MKGSKLVRRYLPPCGKSLAGQSSLFYPFLAGSGRFQSGMDTRSQDSKGRAVKKKESIPDDSALWVK